MTTVTLGTWNEKDNPDLAAWKVRADAAAVHARFRGAVLLGGQEFGEAADHRAIDQEFGPRWPHWPRTEATPIIWNRRRFRLLATEYRTTHGGRPHMTPHRGFARATFKVRRRPRLQPFDFIDTHLISKPYLDDRAPLWAKHVAKMRAYLAERRAATGLDAFVVGDWNKRKPPTLSPYQVVLHGHWLDHILFIPGTRGNRVRVQDRFILRGLHTDHAPVGVRLDITPRRTP